MLNTNRSTKANLTYAYSPANWEEDIQEVVVESCDMEEDPLGYRVIFYRNEAEIGQETENSYRMGASYLRHRLKKLSKAGFDAPMTKKAITLINQKRLIRIP